MSNRLLSHMTNLSPQTRAMADTVLQTLAERSTTLAMAKVDRAKANQIVVAGPDGAADASGVADADAIREARRPVRLSIKQWAATLVCVDLVLGTVLVRLADDPQLALYMYFAVVGPLLSVIDIAVMRLPDWLTLPSYPATIACLGFAAVEFNQTDAMFRALAAGLATLAAFTVLCVVSDTGLGDLKFAGLIGLTLGARSWGSVVEGFAVTWGIATAWGLVQLFRGRLKSRIPLGPYMTAGTMLTLLWHK